MTELLSKCDVCLGLLDEEDLFCANCGKEAPIQETKIVAEKTQKQTSTHNFECTGCGASMSYDASAKALLCPFCGADNLESRPDRPVLAPNRVIPFSIGREQAESILRKWLGNGFWRPGDLSQSASIIKMQPIYVPYWVFEATTFTYWAADTNQLPAWSSGDWRPMYGEHRGRYDGLLVGASGALTAKETAELIPFDLELALPPEEVDLDNHIYEPFQVMRKYARPLARQGLEAYEARTCETRYVPGRCRNMHVNVRLEGLASEPVLLPVWVMAYRYKNRPYRFLVNGQTGKATGTAPNSWKKMTMAVVLTIAAGIALFALAAAMAN